MIRQIYDDSKRPLHDKIRIALDTCRRNHGTLPDLIMVRQEDRGDLKSVDGIPVEVSTSGLILHAHCFEFRMPDPALIVGSIGIVASVESSVDVIQQSLF